MVWSPRHSSSARTQSTEPPIRDPSRARSPDQGRVIARGERRRAAALRRDLHQRVRPVAIRADVCDCVKLAIGGADAIASSRGLDRAVSRFDQDERFGVPARMKGRDGRLAAPVGLAGRFELDDAVLRLVAALLPDGARLVLSAMVGVAEGGARLHPDEQWHAAPSDSRRLRGDGRGRESYEASETTPLSDTGVLLRAKMYAQCVGGVEPRCAGTLTIAIPSLEVPR